jgi:hypothetical protein
VLLDALHGKRLFLAWGTAIPPRRRRTAPRHDGARNLGGDNVS